MYSEPFICAARGEQDTGGLHDFYTICPIPGSDYVENYAKLPWSTVKEGIALPLSEATLFRFRNKDNKNAYDLFTIVNYDTNPITPRSLKEVLNFWEFHGYKLHAYCSMNHICK